MSGVDEILAPVAGDAPCGEDLSFSSEFDAIAEARIADDPSLDQGVWATRCKEADWSFVIQQCRDLLAKRSKDLRLAVWLAEGEARSGRLNGFAEACDILAGLCERYWEQMHPRAEEDQEQRIGNLSWLAQSSVHWLNGIDQSAPGFEAQARKAVEVIEQLEHIIGGKLGADAPSFGETKQLLRNMCTGTDMSPGFDRGPEEAGVPHGAPAAVAFLPTGGPASRMQAMHCLRQVAEFFRRQEPHSPVSYLADKAADWAEMPLHVWLRVVLKDGVAIGQLEELLGTGGRESEGA